METRKCLHCGTEFTGKKNKKFCSDSCKVGAHHKRQNSIVQTVKENKPITKEFLHLIYPDIPDRLLKRKHKIHKLTEAVDSLHNERVVKIINAEIDRLMEIFDLEMQLEELHPESAEAKAIREELNPKLEREKLLYEKRKTYKT